MPIFTLTKQVGLEDPEVIHTYSSLEDAAEDLIQTYNAEVAEIEETIFEAENYDYVFDCDGRRYDSAEAVIAAKMANVTFAIAVGQ